MNEQQYQLVVRKGPETGKVYELSSISMTIGRDPMSEITINDPEVSRRHARLIGTLTGYRIQDLGSTNGTFVDGVRLSGEPLDLKPGQAISIGGGVELVFEGVTDVDDQSVTMIDADMTAFEPMPLETPPVDVAEVEIDKPLDDATVVESDVDEIFETGVESAEVDFQEEPAEESDSTIEPSDEAFTSDSVWDIPQTPVEEELFPITAQADPYEADEFSEPVVIPHQGEPIKPSQDNQSSKVRRASTVIAAVVLLLICCCCSMLLFLYYYGGDWLLRQMGLLP